MSSLLFFFCVTVDQERAWGRAAKLRGTRVEAQAPQSLLLFTINLHNFTFSLTVRL